MQMAKQISNDYLFKILLFGSRRTGKSSLQCRFATGSVSEDYLSTIRPDFLTTTLNIDDKKVKLQLWEPIEDGRFRPIPRNHCRGMHGFILIYDISDRESFMDIRGLLKTIEKDGSEGTVKMLVGNKCDLDRRRQVIYEEGKEYADRLGIRFMEVSAKDGYNVQCALESIVKELINKAEGVEKGNEEVKKKPSKENKEKVNTMEIVAMAFRNVIVFLCIIFIGYLLAH